MPLDEGQWQIDDYVFGLATDPVVVLADGFDLGEEKLRTQDAQTPFSDSTMFGRDYYATQEWAFSFAVQSDGNGWDDVWARLDELKAAWVPDDVRTTPGATQTLRWRRNGQERVVHGRGRGIQVEGQYCWDHEWVLVTASFTRADATVYGGDVFERTLRFGSPSRGGWILPMVLPWPPAVVSGDRPGVLETGTSPVAFTVTFHGDPGRATPGVALIGPSWRIALRDPLKAGSTVVVDTQARTVTVDGVRARALTAASSLSATLPPGRPEVVFVADEPTGATATVTWRPGYRTI